MAAKKAPARKKKPTVKRNPNQPRKETGKKPIDRTENVKFVLRIHPSIHAKIKKQAAENFQSMNEFIHGKMSEAVDPKNTLAYLIKELKKKGVI